MRYRFEFLGKGAYNKVYLVYESTNNNTPIGVFKEQINQEPTASECYSMSEPILEELYRNVDLDTTERSLAIWNEVNPTLPARAFSAIVDGKPVAGWLCPYVQGRQATDAEIVTTLVDIYNRTGRIVVDAVGKRNVITRQDGSSVCIDVGMAVKLDNFYGPLPRMRDKHLHEPKRDMAGVAQWRELQADSFADYYRHGGFAAYCRSIDTIKALLFIRRYREDIKDVSFLIENKELARTLADAYDRDLFFYHRDRGRIESARTRLAEFVPPAEPHVEDVLEVLVVGESTAAAKLKEPLLLPLKTADSKGLMIKLKQITQSYLLHLMQKLDDKKITYSPNIRLTVDFDAPPLIRKLATRYNAIQSLNALLQDRDELDDSLIAETRRVIKACYESQPTWKEQSFLRLLTNIISFGIIPLFRTFFYKSKEASFQETLLNTIDASPKWGG